MDAGASIQNDILSRIVAKDEFSPAQKAYIAGLQQMERETGQVDAFLKKINQSTIAVTQSLRQLATAQSEQTKTTSQQAQETRKAAESFALYERTANQLTSQLNSLAAAGKVGSREWQELDATQRLAVRGANEHLDVLRKQQAGMVSLAGALKQSEQAMREEERAAIRAARARREEAEEQGRGIKLLEGVGRGLASSIFQFSLLAGGAVAAGHVIGNVVREAADDFNRLRLEVTGLAQLNPTLNTERLTDQIRTLELRLGILSQNLTKVAQVTLPQAQGDEGAAMFLTGAEAQAAQANRQDYLKWAQAVTQSMQAYGLTVKDVTHIQDVLTVAMQNSAGQGSDLLELWGSVTKAAAGMQTNLDEAGGAMVTLARHGGDLQENMRALKGGFDALATQHVQELLHSYGVSTEDAAGNTADLLSIIGQLKDLMQGWSPADQSELLKRLFTDRDVVNIMRTLLNNYEEFKNKTNDLATSQGAAQDSIDKFADTQQSFNDQLAANKQALQEWAGQWLDASTYIALVIKGVKDFRDLGPQDQTPGLTLGNQYGRPALPSGQAGLDAQALREQSQYGFNPYAMQQQTIAQAAADESVRALARSTTEYVRVQKSLENQLGLTSEEYKTFVDWSGQLIDSSSSLTTNLDGMTDTFNKLLTNAQALTQSNAFGGFGSEAEQNLANIAEDITNTSDQITRLKVEANNLAKIGIDPDSLLGKLASLGLRTQIQGLQSDLQGLIDKAKQQSREIIAASPEGRAGAEQYAHFNEQQAAAAAMTVAQSHLNDITEHYNGLIKDMQRQQRELQRELRDDSTPALAQARRDLDKATADLEATTAHYAGTIDDLTDQLRQLKLDEVDALKPLRDELDRTKSTLDEWRTGASDVMDILKDQLYDAQDAMEAVRKESEIFLAPFVASAKQAADALTAVDKEITRVDNSFRDSREALEDTIANLEKLSKIKTDPLVREIEDLERHLDDLARAEEAELRPLEDIAYAQSQALREAQDAARALADEYAARLNPLQAELNDLQRESQRIENERTLHDQQVNIENLTARLASAKRGTSEYIQLQQQLVDARNKEMRDRRIFTLQDQIGNIEAERDAATQASNDRVEQAQRELEETNRQIEAIKRRYELERRETEDTLRTKQRALQDEKRALEDLEAPYKAQLDVLNESQKIYDRAARARHDDAVATKELADAALRQAQADRKIIEDAAQLIVDGAQAMIRATQHVQEATERSLGDAVKVAQGAYDTVKDYYDGPDGLIPKLQTKIEKEQEDAREFEASAKAQVKSAQDHYDDLREEIQKNINKLSDQIAVMQDTATYQEDAAKRIIEAERAKQIAIETSWRVQAAYLAFLKSQGYVEPDMPPITPPFNPGGSQLPPYIPPDTSLPPRRGGAQGRPVINPAGSTQVPVAALAPVPGGGGGNLSNGPVHVSIDLSGSQFASGDQLKNEQYWYDVGDAAFRGINRRIGDTYGINIKTTR